MTESVIVGKFAIQAILWLRFRKSQAWSRQWKRTFYLCAWFFFCWQPQTVPFKSKPLHLSAAKQDCGRQLTRWANIQMDPTKLFTGCAEIILKMSFTSSKYFPGNPGGDGESSGSKEGHQGNVSNCGEGALSFLIQCLHNIASCDRLCVCTNVFSRWRPTTRVLPLKCHLDSN